MHRSADRAAGVAGRRLDIDPLERRAPLDLAVGHRIHRAAAGQCQAVQSIARVQRVQQMEKRLLVHGLHRARDVLVALLERLVLAARGAEQILERRREQRAHMRAAARPLVGDLLLVVAEISGVEPVCAIVLKQDDPAHLRHEPWLAIGREPHDLVLVAIVRKAQILGQRLVEDAERMREPYAPVHGNGRALAHYPRQRLRSRRTHRPKP